MPRLKNPFQPPSGYLNGEKSAAKIGVSVRTWWKWRAQKKGPPGTWIGGRLVWREATIDEWLLKREEAMPC